ncbi:serine/threonine-protein kinase VRK1 isoform X2 [Hyalella azteca]|uniref:non-specific serine/threonine protein kinase n=1 Tax=Hyalella azteca TaxID=294128 RepID=A0A8B7P4W6_HYAAZ|nr:serine/threonine-protein kinase VRK1 isoform X2 [Hyalella azteca]
MAPRKVSKGAASKSNETPKKRVAASGYKLPDPIPEGQVITDIAKNVWVLGKSIGQGGFGEIYLASNDSSRVVTDGDKFVVKVEPHSNGPLFAEMHCYMRIAKPELIDAWKKERKLKRLGMPKYLGSGSFIYKSQKYRFMVMERFGSDLQKILEKLNKKFSFKTVFQIGLEILDVLEYIHDKGYIHADIKASNLLVGFQRGTENQVFLVDYGLACRYAINGQHKEYKYDARKAHDGTIEFTSRDAHIGAHSRRGDLEILGYNMTQWLCSRLPWEDNLTDCDYVAKSKRWYMDNVDKLMDKCFPDGVPPGLFEYLSYVASLTFDELPDYEKCRDILRAGLVDRGYKDDGKLVFMAATPKPVSKKPKSRVNKGVKRRRSDEEENIGLSPNKIVRTSPRSPCKSSTNRINTRLCPRKSYLGLSLSTVALPALHFTDPEDIIIEKENEKMLERQKQMRPKRMVLKKDTSLDNPTPQMLALMAKRREKSLSPPMCNKRHKHKLGKTTPTFDDTPTDLTPEMESIIRRREEREAAERAAKHRERLVDIEARRSLNDTANLDVSVLCVSEVSARDRRYQARLQEPSPPVIAVDDLENSNDGFLASPPCCDTPKPSAVTNHNNNSLKQCPRPNGRRKAVESSDNNRSNTKKRNTQYSQKQAHHQFSYSKLDPYEFIDEIFSEYSHKSYKEYSIEHSPVKVNRRVCSARAAKSKFKRGSR